MTFICIQSLGFVLHPVSTLNHKCKLHCLESAVVSFVFMLQLQPIFLEKGMFHTHWKKMVCCIYSILFRHVVARNNIIWMQVLFLVEVQSKGKKRQGSQGPSWQIDAESC